ncbi:SAM-dependent methyltransferase [Bacteroidales bacterium OttesenSCG-928-C03]|nr:SAM-dependent methyltransferase [Bacteroidales bacterium OttesenSCG-928-E04]MDL2308770.1 SAM-dependent methyltransferase [Bacteroidales bacterium OttesenSCG-928-C03]MDL2326096.1 SAM-dependent methyltransferase [Bacteroidales bacterium OttesenSCG-928-A14]
MNIAPLYLIPAPLAEVDFSRIIPNFNLEIINEIDYYIVEELRTARRLLRKMGINKRIEELFFSEINEHVKNVNYNEMLQPCLDGHPMGLLSEAGTPCIADPGSKVVAKAHQLEIPVIPLVGPNSILLALMASGFDGQCFAFQGYLPVDRDKREKEMQFFESIMRKNGQTQIFIETPYRNNHFLDSLLSVCAPDTRICVACNLTAPDQLIITQSVSKWRKTKIDIYKKPTIFLMGK